MENRSIEVIAITRQKEPFRKYPSGLKGEIGGSHSLNLPREEFSFKNLRTSDQGTAVLWESQGFALKLKFNNISG